MKETTRQLVLLFGVLTLLTSSYVVISLADEPADPGNDRPPENITQPDDQQQMNNTGDDDPEGLIERSIRGFELLIGDVGETMSFLSTDSGDSS
ncbi:hypothetical protein ACK3SF_04440 [Candidatus Nanosalina sp. VS9-1]|uniref:hypothetical protein n=1 Tax=Candidatus Nanosalina sp. VS9-1 TaxID=3388566 RepID=UPI0039E0DEE9